MATSIRARALFVGVLAGSVVAIAAPASAMTNNIMLVGYWPPTNEMLRRFSTNPTQNPSGWIGNNWEGRGYNIHSFFPEFPGGIGQGVGDFEVDYQDTSADFWRITNEVKPVAIITFSRGRTTASWEIEARYKNRTTWVNDYTAPLQPTPAPPDPTIAPEALRFSSLPMAQIRDNVNAAQLGFLSWIDDFEQNLAGGFLSEFLGYHGAWYRDMNSTPGDPEYCMFGGHIHVGTNTPLAQAITATEITLRTVITALPSPSTAGVLALAGVVAARRRRA